MNAAILGGLCLLVFLVRERRKAERLARIAAYHAACAAERRIRETARQWDARITAALQECEAAADNADAGWPSLRPPMSARLDGCLLPAHALHRNDYAAFHQHTEE